MSSDIDDLLSAARAAWAGARDDAGEASDEYWRAVRELHRRPVQALFDRCLDFCSSSEPGDRCLGADILGQLGFVDRAYPFRETSIPVLRRLLSDAAPRVVESALFAFSHLGSHDAVPEIASLSRHAEADVRHAVAFALLGDESELAVATLIVLSRDVDSDVRDWSTFGLGAQIDLDTPEIREALFARADDSDSDTQGEALSGLVRRRDPRAATALARAGGGVRHLAPRGRRPRARRCRARWPARGAAIMVGRRSRLARARRRSMRPGRWSRLGRRRSRGALFASHRGTC